MRAQEFITEGFLGEADASAVQFRTASTDNYQSSFTVTAIADGKNVGHFSFYRDPETEDVHNQAEVTDDVRGKGYGKALLLKAIEVANDHGLGFQEDSQSLSRAQSRVYDSLYDAGWIVDADGYWLLTPEGEQELARLSTIQQGVAEGKVINTYLWHGSRQKIPMLEPRQSVDTGGAAGSNQNAIYATSDPKVAIAMGLTTPGSDTGMFPNDPQMVLFSGKIRKGEYVYLHKLPFNGPDGKPQFVQGGNSREFHSIPGVEGIKPIEIKEIPVNKYLNLIRKATPADLKLRKKYMKKQGVAEGKLSVDVPNEEWLQDKIDYAKSKGRNSYGVPYMGSTTAGVVGTPPRVRVMRLASLPGMRNEQMNVRKNDLKWLMDYMDKTGKLPPMGSNPNEEYLPYIMVAYNGEAWVNEGNHRIMAAYRLNWPDMPVEIRYFDGGERIATGPMAPGKIGLA